jgi:hypothetical protein
MGGDFVKELFGALDKITDILNLGRLIFYTAAGFPPVLALAMILRTVGAEDKSYWAQFKGDFVACSGSKGVWLGAMIAGFMVANIVYARSMSHLRIKPAGKVQKTGFVYQYPMLRTGRLKRGASEADFDFAAWLISEYYRYFEIVMYIPYGVLLSLPLLTAYSFARILLDSQHPARLDACFFGFGLWLTASALGWTVWWREYWLPKVATPVYEVFELANAEIISGVRAYSSGVPDAPAVPPKPDPSKKTEKKS